MNKTTVFYASDVFVFMFWYTFFYLSLFLFFFQIHVENFLHIEINTLVIRAYKVPVLLNGKQSYDCLIRSLLIRQRMQNL